MKKINLKPSFSISKRKEVILLFLSFLLLLITKYKADGQLAHHKIHEIEDSLQKTNTLGQGREHKTAVSQFFRRAGYDLYIMRIDEKDDKICEAVSLPFYSKTLD